MTTFTITPPVLNQLGAMITADSAQFAIDQLANQTQSALNALVVGASSPIGPATGDLGGTYPAPLVVGLHAVNGSIDNVIIGATTPQAATLSTLTVTGATILHGALGVTAALGDSSTKLATTAFVIANGNTGGVVPITSGGTGATTAPIARLNLGLYSMATQPAASVTITGGTIDNTSIGATTPASIIASTLNVIGVTSLAAATGVTAGLGDVSVNLATTAFVAANSMPAGITPITMGGTNASTPSAARSNLGLGTMATQNYNNVAISGGAIDGTIIGLNSATNAFFTAAVATNLAVSGLTTLANATGFTMALNDSSKNLATTEFVLQNATYGVSPVANGGTGATTAPQARINLGLGTLSTQNFSSVGITGGAIDGTAIGANSATTGAFSALTVTGLTTLGVATGVTATAGDISTKLATTAFVKANTGSFTGVVPISQGGTGAITVTAAQTALGLGTIATQNANLVTITGGNIDGTAIGQTSAAAAKHTTLTVTGATTLGAATGVTLGSGDSSISLATTAFVANNSLTNTSIIQIANGGTGAITGGAARANLGMGNMAIQNANNVAIVGGTFDFTPIGSSAPSTGAFTTLLSTGLSTLQTLTVNGATALNNAATALTPSYPSNTSNIATTSYVTTAINAIVTPSGTETLAGYGRSRVRATLATQGVTVNFTANCLQYTKNGALIPSGFAVNGFSQAFNINSGGQNGTDGSTMVVGGYMAVYAMSNAAGTAQCTFGVPLAFNGTAPDTCVSTGPNFAAINTNFPYSTLLCVIPIGTSIQTMAPFTLMDRTVSIIRNLISIGLSNTPQTVDLHNAIPANATSFAGNLELDNAAGNVNNILFSPTNNSATPNGIGLNPGIRQFFFYMPTGDGEYILEFAPFPVYVPQTCYVQSSTGANQGAIIYISSYTF